METITAVHAVSILAEQQHGAFSSTQAFALGMHPRTLQKRTVRGFYRRVHDGVFVVAGSTPSWLRRVSAAVLSEGELAAASHQTAAHLLGITDRRGPAIDVVTRRWRRRKRPGIRVHESVDLIFGDIQIVDGIPTTNAARTVVDLGATAPWLVSGALGTALRTTATSLDEVDAFVRRVARRGRRGVGIVRPLIAERREIEGSSESELEDRFARLVVDFSLPKPTPQFIVFDDRGDLVCRADFAYPEARLIIELDGFAYHGDEQAFQRDRTKQNRVLALGWSVLRYTWRDVVDRPAMVAAEIHTVLASSAAQ